MRRTPRYRRGLQRMLGTPGSASLPCMPTTAKAALAALTVIVSLLLAGCGGASRPTQAQYAAKADAICHTASTQTGPLVTQLASAAGSLSSGGQTAARQLTEALQSLHDAAAGSLAKLRALEQPSNHAAVQEFLSSYATVTDALTGAAASAAAGQPQQALAKLQSALSASRQMAAAAKTSGMASCEGLFPTTGATVPAQSIHATLLGQSHHPAVGRPWRYTVTVTDAQGHPLSGTETTHYAFNGVIVGTEQPQNVSFTHGRYVDTIEFPGAAVGHPLELQVVVDAGQGSVTLHWPIEVVG